jgi:hypothetical protein
MGGLSCGQATAVPYIKKISTKVFLGDGWASGFYPGLIDDIKNLGKNRKSRHLSRSLEMILDRARGRQSSPPMNSGVKSENVIWGEGVTRKEDAPNNAPGGQARPASV